MNLKQQILKVIIENKEKEFTIRGLSKKLKKDYKNTYDAVQNLIGSLNINKKGNATYITYAPKLTNQIYEAEQARRDAVIKKIKILYRDIQTASNPFFAAILFGSFAKGNETKNSDIDICIIHDNEDEIKPTLSRLRILPRIQLHPFHYSEFVQLLKNKDFNVGHEIVKDGIILRNIELFYEVIRHG
ncbi:MAG: nucleotidyltransferase domain-containing protein [DPANN group archaeon]|nr:nucleotidyltransferase domain-containing protein [DPANN group archaeon]